MLNGSMIPRGVRRMFDERSEPREATGSQAATLELRGRRHEIQLVNMSASGAMIAFDAAPRIGEEVVLDMGDRGRVMGQVCWVRDGHIGVTFAGGTE
jgi:PilZ domain